MTSENLKSHKIFAEIPARGGSKGVPRKAVRFLSDQPLIAYTIKDALAVAGVTKVFVNTDDPEIREISTHYGAEVPFLRPKELARDNSKLEDATKYARDWYKKNENFIPDIEIIMSPTHPFRRRNLINNALESGFDDPEIFNLGSIATANVTVDNYWFKSKGHLQPFCGSANVKGKRIVFYRSAFSFNIVFCCRSNLLNRRVPIMLNDIESIDIDEPKDFEIARMVVSEGLYPFNDSH